jgi:epidermal growth factor receptor substrate 15
MTNNPDNIKKQFVPVTQTTELKPQLNNPVNETSNSNSVDEVTRAINDQKIAEANLKKRLAEEGLQSLDQLKEEKNKLNEAKSKVKQDIAKWENDKAKFIAENEKEKEDIRKVKEYWEQKAKPVQEMENSFIVREERLNNKIASIEEQRKAVVNEIKALDETIQSKKDEIDELQRIIDEDAPHYLELFKKLERRGEKKVDYNYNMAQGDKWHNFVQSVKGIKESLYRMMFGES